MRDFVVACNAGCLHDTPVIDTNYQEDNAGGAALCAAILPNLDKTTMVEMESRVGLCVS